MSGKNEPETDFQFTVSEPHDYEYNGHTGRVPYWQVYLPHQCGEWEVMSSTDHSVVVAEMERFVRQAQAALAELKAKAEPKEPQC